MKKVIALASALFTAWLMSAGAVSAQPYIYPSKGQSQQQQDEDQGACMHFATQQTGFNPMATPTASSPEPQQEGGVGRGAVGGALLGTAIGAIAGDTGKGAAIGAVSGGLFGGMRRSNSRNEQEQWQQQQAAQQQAGRSDFNRAFSACMQGRGYSVN